MSTDHDTAMAELRRACSGERSKRPIPVLPPPELEDLYTGLPYRPRLSVKRDGGSVGGEGHTDNAASPPVGWAFMVLLVLYTTSTVGAIMYFWGHP